MKGVVSFFMICVMTFANFFSGLSSAPEDLETTDSLIPEYELSLSEKELLKHVFETETAWLASLQLENGAIPMYQGTDGEFSLNPYFSDFAALALLDNAGKYAENVKAYMNWHFSHLNAADEDYNKVDGTIYDYSVTLENAGIVKEESKNSYDSTDSYAATFLMVLEKYYEKTGDKEYILGHYSDILRIIDAMLVTAHRGLTFAKPDYKVKYLMDNCEVYDGLLSAAALLDAIDEDGLGIKLTVKKCEEAAELLQGRIEKKLWSRKGNHYHSGIFADGKAISKFSWSEYYPCATAQLFPINHGLIGADTIRANALYEAFCNNFSWEKLEIPSDFCWGSNVYAAAVMGDAQKVLEYMQIYSEKYMSTHAYPLYNADAARVSMAAYLLLNS